MPCAEAIITCHIRYDNIDDDYSVIADGDCGDIIFIDKDKDTAINNMREALSMWYGNGYMLRWKDLT
jgi:hypothetical protein